MRKIIIETSYEGCDDTPAVISRSFEIEEVLEEIRELLQEKVPGNSKVLKWSVCIEYERG